MAEFVRVARLSDIPPGTVKGVKARGKEILIAKFDVTDGGVCGWVTHPGWYRLLMDALYPGFLKRGVGSYKTRVEGDDVYVEV